MRREIYLSRRDAELRDVGEQLLSGTVCMEIPGEEVRHLG